MIENANIVLCSVKTIHLLKCQMLRFFKMFLCRAIFVQRTFRCSSTISAFENLIYIWVVPQLLHKVIHFIIWVGFVYNTRICLNSRTENKWWLFNILLYRDTGLLFSHLIFGTLWTIEKKCILKFVHTKMHQGKYYIRPMFIFVNRLLAL